MYFVNIRKKFNSSTFLLHLLPAGTVLIAVLGLTFLGWRNAQQVYETEYKNSSQLIVNDTVNTIREKIETYELILVGAKGLFDATGEIDKQAWKLFVTNYNTPKAYPGIQGVGYSEYIQKNGATEFIRSLRSEGFQNVTIFPEGTRNEYVVLRYYEPQNINAVGFDMLSESTRKEAIMQSKESGESVISGKIKLLQSKTTFQENGFLMFAPVYSNVAQRSVEANERAIQGFVFVPFVADNFFNQALSELNSHTFGLRVYDSDQTQDKLLYETTNYSTFDKSGVKTHIVPLTINGRDWILEFKLSPDAIVGTTARTRPISSLVLGIMLSLLLSGFVLTLLIARTRVLTHAKQLEVQSAKDELLSLASHQLRTPATSVKQYLGMALEGFAGKLSQQQRILLDKAYESNERQLGIINEILYVAKIDAKGIVLTPRQINLNKLLRDLVDELAVTAKKNKQKIRLHLPVRQITIEADEHCVRMALENLISNALKYSYEDSTSSVKLHSGRGYVKITIKDRGVGIDEEDLPLLFQRFSRIPNELSRQTSGSGIGLYLSQQLIELHGGEIVVDSVKGKGTTFEVTLPKKYTQSTSRRDGV